LELMLGLAEELGGAFFAGATVTDASRAGDGTCACESENEPQQKSTSAKKQAR
jgi:hypothetical protein